MKIIDFEAHCYIPEFTGKFHAAVIAEANRKLPEGKKITVLDEILDLGEGRIAQMDRCGVEKQILSMSSGVSHLSHAEAVEISCRANARMYEAIRRYPGRFGAFAQLPENDPDAAVRELERCMGEYGFFGWNTFSNYGESWLDEEYFFPILKRASELGAPVYLHPDFPGSVGFPRLLGLGTSLYAGVGYTFDTSVTLLRLMYNGTFDRLPDLKVIIGHLGEGIASYLDRLADKEGEGMVPPLGGGSARKTSDGPRNRQSLRQYFRNQVFVTNSGNYSVPAVRCAVDVFGADRMLFGSDYPYEPFPKAVEFTLDCGLSEEEKELLCHGNAERAFFPLL